MGSLLAYHGTPFVSQVLAEGLKADKASGPCHHIWLARLPNDAAAFGVVLEVNMDGIEGDFEPGAWQGCYHGGDLELWLLRLWQAKHERGNRDEGSHRP